ncbi:uncharacterized protein [Aquarana catesbeiana]|uniref:uncharacterized protein n=1 Tax=Aquarana catesbeiana TaxID=8400 RepID=UPI003CC9C24B
MLQRRIFDFLCGSRGLSAELKNKHGIFSRSTNSDYSWSWITKLLQSDHFKDCVSDVKPFVISNDPINTEECSFGILYFTKKEGQISAIDATEVQLIQHYRSRLGKDNVIIVMDDVEDSNDQEKIRILESHPDIEDLYHNLFLFSPQEKQSKYKNFFSSLMTINKAKVAEVSFKGNMDKIRKIVESTCPENWWFFTKPHTVGIFSRSSESDFEWLIKQLKSESFCNIVSTANPHSISNNGMQQFMDAVSGCTFGILYHTRNRGRINIVDVTDSLYNEELKYLSEHLGKEKVIVVVDDLEDASDEEKTRILQSQPSVGTLARDIFLFNANDKKKTYDN